MSLNETPAAAYVAWYRANRLSRWERSAKAPRTTRQRMPCSTPWPNGAEARALCFQRIGTPIKAPAGGSYPAASDFFEPRNYHESKPETRDASVINATISRLNDLIGTAENLRRTIESERAGSLLPTFTPTRRRRRNRLHGHGVERTRGQTDGGQSRRITMTTLRRHMPPVFAHNTRFSML